MNNMIKKLILLILIFIIVLIGINIYTSLINTHSKEYESDIISKSNAKTLEIYNHRITNLSERSGNDVTAIVKMIHFVFFPIYFPFGYFQQNAPGIIPT